jgi:ankyrin repeat protein
MEHMQVSADQLNNNPQEFLEWIKAHPEYVNAQVVDSTSEKYHLFDLLFLRKANAARYGNTQAINYYDLIISFVISKSDLSKYQNIAILIPWAAITDDINKMSDRINLLLEKGINAEKMLTVINNLIQVNSHEKRLKAAQEKLEEIISFRAATEIKPYTFPDIACAMKPSDPRICAIKHAIEDDDLKALAEALEIPDNVGIWYDANNELLELRDQTGYTPLLYAAYLGKEKAMHFLVELGADINAQTKDGANATDFGDYRKLIDEARLARERKKAELKKNGEEQLKRDSETVFHAIENNLLDQIMIFAIPAVINMKNNAGNTPLIEAASSGKIEIVKELLKKNPDISLTNYNGNTALQSAIYSNHFDIANLLVELMDKKALQNKNEQGFTAQDLAIWQEDRNKDNAQFHAFMKTLKGKLDDK